MHPALAFTCAYLPAAAAQGRQGDALEDPCRPATQIEQAVDAEDDETLPGLQGNATTRGSRPGS